MDTLRDGEKQKRAVIAMGGGPYEHYAKFCQFLESSMKVARSMRVSQVIHRCFRMALILRQPSLLPLTLTFLGRRRSGTSLLCYMNYEASTNGGGNVFTAPS